MVLITMGAAAIALMGALGMAVDIGRLYIVKNEAQTYADAEALAAALQLNGAATGITNAENAVTSSSSTFNFSDRDKWNFSTCSLLTSASGCTSTAPTVDFSTTATGPWYADATAITGAGVAFTDIDTVLVKARVSPQLYFIPAVMATRVFTQTVNVSAVAGQVPITSLSKGLAPFSAVAGGTTGPNFGLTEGTEYTIQWPQYNSTRQHCNNGQPENCFVRPPCAGDSRQALQDVVQHWGAQTNGYWGFNSGADIRDSILGTLQLTAVPVGTDLGPLGADVLTNGNKASSANYTDDRVNSDTVNYGNNYTTYKNTPQHNGRRMIVVPIVHPNNDAGGGSVSTVVGYGQFFLMSNANNSGQLSDYYQRVTGNEPYCAIYAGPFNLGSFDPGGGGSTTGASRVRLME